MRKNIQSVLAAMALVLTIGVFANAEAALLRSDDIARMCMDLHRKANTSPSMDRVAMALLQFGKLQPPGVRDEAADEAYLTIVDDCLDPNPPRDGEFVVNWENEANDELQEVYDTTLNKMSCKQRRYQCKNVSIDGIFGGASDILHNQADDIITAKQKFEKFYSSLRPLGKAYFDLSLCKIAQAEDALNVPKTTQRARHRTIIDAWRRCGLTGSHRWKPLMP